MTDEELEEMRAAYEAMYIMNGYRPEISARENFYHGYFRALRRSNGR